ncbi:hypothetical protein ACFSTC_61010 [Nonomuraea ferruginea]
MEQASNVVKSGDGYAVTWAAVLANGNPWHFGEHVVASVVGKDAGGREVFRMDQPLDAVPPGGSLTFTGQGTATAKPTKVSVDYRPAQWRQAARVPSAFRPFPASRVQTMRQKDGSYLITGYVANPYQLPASSLVVSALLRDGAEQAARRRQHVRGRRAGGLTAAVHPDRGRAAAGDEGGQDRGGRPYLGGRPRARTRNWRWAA